MLREMDPSNDNTTPRSDGRGNSSDGNGNGDCSVKTSSQRCHRMPSSPTGTQLISEFDVVGDAKGSGSSSSPLSSRALDSEGVHHLATLEATDNTIIMVDELLDDDDERGAPSSTTRSASPVDNNRLDTSSNARRSTYVVNNRPSNRVSDRCNSSNDQFPRREEHRGMYAPRNNRNYEVGSSSRQAALEQWQGVSQPNIQMSDPYPFLRLAPSSRIPLSMNFPVTLPPWVGSGFAGGLRVQLGAPVQGPMYLYGSPALSTYPPFEVATVVPARRSSGLYPLPGVTIRHPPTRSRDQPPLLEQPARTRVTITAPPDSEWDSSSAPKQPEATSPAQLEVRPSQPVLLARVPTVWWPPIAEEDALYIERLYGPSRLPRRLPVFQNICPSNEPSQPPPPPPLPSQPPPLPSSPPPPPPSPPPSPPPPPSQSPPPPPWSP